MSATKAKWKKIASLSIRPKLPQLLQNSRDYQAHAEIPRKFFNLR